MAQTVLSEYELVAPQSDELRPVVALAAAVAQVPMAAINVIDATSQYQVAAVGFDGSICTREDSMCAVAVDAGRPILVPDASLDDRFRANPFVTGSLGQVRFYGSYPLRMSTGRVLGTLCVFDVEPRVLDAEQVRHLVTLAERVVDVVELAQRSRELDQSLRRSERLTTELRRSNAHLSAFAGEVSHDLGNPLSAVEMSLASLERRVSAGAEPSELEPWIETGLQATDRMRSTIDDFLDFARIGGAAERVPVDLGEVARQVCADLDLGEQVQVRELPVVAGHRGQLGAVLHNLLGNARKFGRGGLIEVESTSTDHGWRVQVLDRGIGIDGSRAEDLFEPHVRGTDETDGFGIGLSTCRRVIQAHDGRIGLSPRDGGGTVAWFELPGVDEAA